MLPPMLPPMSEHPILICPLAEHCIHWCGCSIPHPPHDVCMTGECEELDISVTCRPATQQDIEDYNIKLVVARLEGQ